MTWRKHECVGHYFCSFEAILIESSKITTAETHPRNVRTRHNAYVSMYKKRPLFNCRVPDYSPADATKSSFSCSTPGLD